MAYLSKIMAVIGFFCMALALALLLQIDVAAWHAADALAPGSGLWVCAALGTAELFALFWLYRALFARQAKLVLAREATEAERQAFQDEMRRRLIRNSHVRAAGLDPDDPGFMENAMALLDKRAEEEIRSGGRKVFLGTALAQNGRLDALIMFLALARMVWRISAVYNQRPTPREIWSVYSTVSSATFVAFSIDALDIPRTISDAMGELVPSVAPAMAASSMPLVGPAVHAFTTAVIDGAANCLVAVRAGVITRRAYRYAMHGGEENLRRSCVRETGAIMLDISQESVGAIVKALRKELQDLSLNSGRRLVDNASKVTETVTDTMASAASGVARAAAGTAGAVSAGAQSVAGHGKATVDAISSGVQQMAETVREGAGALGDAAKAVGGEVAAGLTALGDAGKGTASLARRAGRNLLRFLSGKGGGKDS